MISSVITTAGAKSRIIVKMPDGYMLNHPTAKQTISINVAKLFRLFLRIRFSILLFDP